MQIHINTSDGSPYYTQILAQVRFMIATGRLAPDERLPPVRKLAEQLTLNPNTVARAYRELEAEGLVTSRRGAGVFVSDGVSPLSRKEQTRVINERIDALLTSAQQLDVDDETLLKLVRQRAKKLKGSQK